MVWFGVLYLVGPLTAAAAYVTSGALTGALPSELRSWVRMINDVFGIWAPVLVGEPLRRALPGQTLRPPFPRGSPGFRDSRRDSLTLLLPPALRWMSARIAGVCFGGLRPCLHGDNRTVSRLLVNPGPPAAT